MTDQEPTESGRLERMIDRKVAPPRTGVITKVYEHTQADDRWNFHVDVRISPESHPRRVPVAVSGPDLIFPPRSDGHPDGPDLAFVQFFNDDSESTRPIVTHILYNVEDRPPLGEEGMFRLVRGSLYVEVDPLGDWARISKKGADDGTPSAKLELDDSGSQTVATVDADTVVLGSGGNGIITDVVAETTKDADGHVTDVTLNITRSTVSETE